MRYVTYVPAAILVASFLGTACDDASSLTAPSPTSDVTTGQPAPPPLPPGWANLVGVYDVSLHLTAVQGSGCIADTMRSQLDVAQPYSVTFASNGTVSLASVSPSFVCTFDGASTGETGFTTAGVGYYRCEPYVVSFRCSDGSDHRIYTFGQDLSGQVTGNDIVGTWEVSWLDEADHEVYVTAQYKGSR